MKKLSILFILTIIVAAAFSSCRKVDGTGPVVTEFRNVSGFTEIKSEISADIIVTPAAAYSVKIEAQQNIIDVIETVLNDGMITLRVKSNTVIKPDAKVKIYISSPDIQGLIVSGSGNMQVSDALTSSHLYLKTSGSGNINISRLNGQSIDANISGSGEININEGAIHEELIDISGSGSMNMSNLTTVNSDIKIAGSGNAKVNVIDYLKVRITGSGSVYYKGTPTIDVNITGSGKLKPM